MGLFGGGKNKGQKLKMWKTTYKCGDCNHDKFSEVKHYSGERFDRFKAECAKCGSILSEEGPYHDPKKR